MATTVRIAAARGSRCVLFVVSREREHWGIRYMPPKVLLPLEGSEPQCKGYLGPVPPNGISIGSSVFAELAIVTNRQTYRETAPFSL